MGFRQVTPQSKVNNYLDRQIQKRIQVIINIFNWVGMQCVKIARDATKLNTFKDQTGNLRSSIGYAILIDGKIYKTDFKQVKEGAEGKKTGLNLINELARKHSRGIVLIVVAGMNYASYVETKRDVLTSSELQAKVLLPKMLKQLGLK